MICCGVTSSVSHPLIAHGQEPMKLLHLYERGLRLAKNFNDFFGQWSVKKSFKLYLILRRSFHFWGRLCERWIALSNEL